MYWIAETIVNGKKKSKKLPLFDNDDSPSSSNIEDPEKAFLPGVMVNICFIVVLNKFLWVQYWVMCLASTYWLLFCLFSSTKSAYTWKYWYSSASFNSYKSGTSQAEIARKLGSTSCKFHWSIWWWTPGTDRIVLFLSKSVDTRSNSSLSRLLFWKCTMLRLLFE